MWPGPLLLLLAELVYESLLAAAGGASIMTRRHRGVTSAAEAVLPRLVTVTRVRGRGVTRLQLAR